MADSIVQSVLGMIGDPHSIPYIVKEIIVFVISLMPILELRGGLIAARLLEVSAMQAYIICVVANIIPIPIILLLINVILKWMRNSKIKFFNSIANWLDAKVEKHKGQIEKYGYFGVVLFVGIPLPGTGAWTGSLIASVLELDKKKTFLAALIGVFIASFIMFALTYGLFGTPTV